MKRFHLDKHAAGIMTIGHIQYEEDELISTRELAKWTGRVRSYGR